MRKLLAFFITAAVLQATPALALVGGPWGNNSHEDNSDGVFSATIMMRGGVGIAKWSQIASIPEISRYAESVVWYKGVVYFGTCYGNVDTLSRTVTGVTEGEVNVPMSGIGTKGNGPIGFCNTKWHGRVKSMARSVSFTAKGHAAFYGDYSDEFLPDTVIETVDTDVTIDPNTGQATQTVVTTTTQTFPGASGPNASFPEFESRTRVLVFGSRVATIGQFYPGAVTSRAGAGFDALAAGGGGGGGGGGGAP